MLHWLKPTMALIPHLITINLYFQFGAFIVYFFDYTIGSGWWLMVLYVMQLCAIFVIRGKPYSGEQVVSVLITKANFCASWLSPLLAFSWHVVRIISWLIFATQFFIRVCSYRIIINRNVLLFKQFYFCVNGNVLRNFSLNYFVSEYFCKIHSSFFSFEFKSFDKSVI